MEACINVSNTRLWDDVYFVVLLHCALNTLTATRIPFLSFWQLRYKRLIFPTCCIVFARFFLTMFPKSFSHSLRYWYSGTNNRVLILRFILVFWVSVSCTLQSASSGQTRNSKFIFTLLKICIWVEDLYRTYVETRKTQLSSTKWSEL